MRHEVEEYIQNLDKTLIWDTLYTFQQKTKKR